MLELKQDKKIKLLRGFTLAESLLAILILTMSIMTPLGLALQSLKYSSIAVEKIEATYMAEEAIEMIYNIKKSAEIYCSDVSNPHSVCNNYFNDYFINADVIDSKCLGVDASGTKYCNFDNSNIIVDISGDMSVKIKNVDNAKRFLSKNTTGISSAVYSVTDYQRRINISEADVNELDVSVGPGGWPNSAKITVIVCIRNSGTCDENSENKVILQNYVSR